MSHTVELLWFTGCPNHPAARAMVRQVVAELAPGTAIRDVDATDPALKRHLIRLWTRDEGRRAFHA